MVVGSAFQPGEPVRAVGFGEFSGRVVLATGGAGGVQIWDVEAGELLGRFGGIGDVRAVAFGDIGGRAVLVAGGGLGVHISDPRDGGQLLRFGQAESVYALVLADIGGLSMLLTAGTAGLTGWDTASGVQMLRPVSAPLLSVTCGTFHDRTIIAAGGNGGYCRIWDALTGDQLHRIEGLALPVLSLAFGTVSGRALVAAGVGDGAWLLDPSSGERRRLMSGGGAVEAVAFWSAADRPLVAGGCSDRTIRLWDPSTGEELARLEGHLGFVTAVALGELYGRYVLASGSDDGTVRLWDPATGEQIRPEPRGPIDADVQFTAYRPRQVRPGRWYDLLAFAHRTQAVEGSDGEIIDPMVEMERQAGTALGTERGRYGSVSTDAGAAVPRGTDLFFEPWLERAEFNPEHVAVRWEEPVHRAAFRLRVARAEHGERLAGGLRIFVGPLLIGELTFQIMVSTSAHEPTPIERGEPLVRYRKIFASYSHEDVAVVEAVAGTTESLGDEYLLDARSIRSGEQWAARLEQLIEQADVFQLFWSHNAMRSQFVRREWEHALSLQRAGFVRPVYWEEPLPADPEADLPPAALSELHFSRLALSASPGSRRFSAGDQRAGVSMPHRSEAAAEATSVSEPVHAPPAVRGAPRAEPPRTKVATTHDVFVSYSSSDIETARRLVQHLEDTGLRCWIAARDISPGADFADQVLRAIDTSRAVVVLVSDAANSSPHVRRELERTIGLGREIIPLQVGATVSPDKLSYFFSGAQRIHIGTNPDAQALEAVVVALRGGSRGRNGRPPVPFHEVVSEGGSTVRPATRHRLATFALLCAATLVLAPLGLILGLICLVSSRNREEGRIAAWAAVVVSLAVLIAAGGAAAYLVASG